MSIVRTRIAPSPTGYLHLGTARTALFNYLFARQNNGVFVLRIEDTDLERSDKKYDKDIIEGLKWLGIEWDEGVDAGGDYAPYRQSERIYTYSKYIKKLLDEKKAFYCWHTKEELEKEKKEQIKNGQAPRHLCQYKKFQIPNSKLQTNSKLNIKNAIIRFDAPVKKIIFNDLIRGQIEFDTALLGDISIAKNIGTPLYNFAVVIDDFEMKISHVIRGEDHISNTPKQILLQEALGFPIPQYAHLPLILGPDRSKLSKRHGAVSINWYREQGYLPEAMINFMAFLGWSAQDEDHNDKEIFSLKELTREFSLEKIQKSGAVFNIAKLDWINGYYIRQTPIRKLTKLCAPYLKSKTTLLSDRIRGGAIEQNQEDYFSKIVQLERERIKKLSDIAELADFFLTDKLEYDKELLKWKEVSDDELREILQRITNIFENVPEKDWTKEKLESFLAEEARRVGDNGKVFWPLRAALSGKKASPGPLEIAEILGKERCLRRIKKAISKIK